jgi:hypothetical protein
MTSQNPIDALFEMPTLEICVTSETAATNNMMTSRWTCGITRADAAGALLRVYSPFNKQNLYLPWSSILSVEPAPAP